MILYLTATAAVMVFACGILSRRERACAVGLSPRGKISRRVLTGRVLLAGIFAILFGILALRINVGNDYAKYVEFMHLARFGGYVPTEPGFNFLAWSAYRIFGEENFLFCFGVMAFVTVAAFLAAIDGLADSFPVSFAMFMLLGYYFQSISTVRYYLALAVTTWAIVCLLKKDWPKFVLLVLFAASFHKSALLVLVLYPFALLRFRRELLVLLGAGGLAAFLLRAQVLRVVLFLYPTYQETSYAAGGEGSLISVFRCAAVLFLTVLYDRGSLLGGGDTEDEADGRMRFYCHCNLLALILYICFNYLPVISRIGYYLTITQIFYVPALLRRVPAGVRRKLACAGTALFCLVFFVHMMRHASADGFRILPYQTFLFHDMPPILSDTGY